MQIIALEMHFKKSLPHLIDEIDIPMYNKDAQSACRKSVCQTQMKNNLKLKSGILFTSIHWVLTEAKQASLTTLR